MDGFMSREARLNAVKLLLDYAIAESQELRLRQLKELLDDAVRAVEQSLKSNAPVAGLREHRRDIRLVVDRDRLRQKERGAKG